MADRDNAAVEPRILILGASGYLGSALHTDLTRRGMDTVVGTSTRPIDGLLQFDQETDSVQQVVGDEWFSHEGPAFAILCASLSPMECWRTEATKARTVMVDGAKRSCDELMARGVTPVFLSTSYVFDGSTGGYAESDIPSPVCAYGRLKREFEAWLLAEHPRALVLRLGKMIDTNPEHSALYAEWRANALRNDPIRCIRGQTLSFTLVDDFVRGLVTICHAGLSGLYHFANPEKMTRAKAASMLLDALGLNTPILEEDPERFGFIEPPPMQAWLRSDRITSALSFDFTSVAKQVQCFSNRCSTSL